METKQEAEGGLQGNCALYKELTVWEPQIP